MAAFTTFALVTGTAVKVPKPSVEVPTPALGEGGSVRWHEGYRERQAKWLDFTLHRHS
jgi:hypothetical protein